MAGDEKKRTWALGGKRDLADVSSSVDGVGHALALLVARKRRRRPPRIRRRSHVGLIVYNVLSANMGHYSAVIVYEESSISF